MITIPHVETNITTACTNTCVGCNHLIPIQRPTFVTPEQVKRDLTEIGKVARIDRWAVIGGEPTLHPQIDDILFAAQESHAVDWIEVWTNGARIQKMSYEFWALIDEIDLTLYPGKPADVDWIAAKCREYDVALSVKKAEDYFTRTFYRREASDIEAAGVYRNCWYKDNCRVLDNGVFYRCCPMPFIPSLLMDLQPGTDGLPLDGITEDKLAVYLAQPETPRSCYRCAGHAGQHIGWRETTREKWLEESLG